MAYVYDPENAYDFISDPRFDSADKASSDSEFAAEVNVLSTY